MNLYYRAAAVLLSFCLLLASTCKKEDLAGLRTVELNTPFDIAISKKATIQGTSTVIDLTEITDNRCPADVQCFSAGDVKVKLNVTGLETNNRILNFCIGQCEDQYRNADTLIIRYKNEAYSIILSDVNPYPGTGSEKRTAVFTVKKG